MLQLFIEAPHNMPSVSSDDGGLEDREEDFFEQSEKESEKVGEVRNATAVCSVPKVASGANLASVRFRFDSHFSVFPLWALSHSISERSLERKGSF
jgi:hypothetical protein